MLSNACHTCRIGGTRIPLLTSLFAVAGAILVLLLIGDAGIILELGIGVGGGGGPGPVLVVDAVMDADRLNRILQPQFLARVRDRQRGYLILS